MKVKDALLLDLSDELISFLSNHKLDNYVTLSTNGELVVCENNEYNRFLLEPETFSKEEYNKLYEENFGEFVWYSPVGYQPRINKALS